MQDKPRNIAWLALVSFGVIAAGVTVIAVIESYSNLLAFARVYGLSGWRAAIAPGAVDSFIVMGELLLFAAIILAWGKAAHLFGGVMAAWGFLLSVGGNVWHASSATIADRAVSAIWPVTATAGLAGALLIVRQLVMVSGVPSRRAAPSADGRTLAPAGQGTGNGLTPPVRRRARSAVAAVDEQALLAELLSAGGPLPSFRSLSLEKTGMDRSRAVKRVYDQARAAMNGGR